MSKAQPAVPASPAPAYSLVSHNDSKEPDSDVISLANSLGSEETTIQDLQDLDVDSETLLSTLETLLSIQNDATHGTKRLQRATYGGGGDEVLDPSAEAAKQLFELSKELMRTIQSHVDAEGRLQLRLKTTYLKDFKAEAGSVPRESINDDGDDESGRDTRDRAQHVSATVLKWSSDCMMAMLSLQADVEVLLSQDDKEEQKRSVAAKRLEDRGEVVSDDDDDEVDDVRSISDAESWTESIDLEDADEAEMVVTLHRHLGPLKSLTGRVRDILHMIDSIVAKPVHLTPATTNITSGANFSYRNREKQPASPPLSQSKQSLPVAVYPQQAPLEPRSDYFLLRKELYDLKDQLVETKNLAHRIRTFAIDLDETETLHPKSTTSDPDPDPTLHSPKPFADGSLTARRCFAYSTGLLDVVEELLSNNGEDWISSEQRGRMGFETFQQLDRDWIASIRQRLRSEQERLISDDVRLSQYHVADPLTEVLQEGLILFGVDAEAIDRRGADEPTPEDYERWNIALAKRRTYESWIEKREQARRDASGEVLLSAEDFIQREEDELVMWKALGEGKDKGKGKEKMVTFADEQEIIDENGADGWEKQGETLPARTYRRPGPVDADMLAERLAVLGDW